MDLHQLRSFVAVAEAGGFSRAAARLHLSQPALSRRVRGLEGELGVRLFDRVGRATGLTAEGLDLLRRARALVADSEALAERARTLRDGETGVLRVGTTPQTLESLLSAFLPRYRGRHLGVEVHLVEDGGPRVLAELERGQLHLAVTVEDPRFGGRRLFPGIALAVMARGHRLARHRRLDVRDLADEPLLVLRREFGTRQWLEAACEATRTRPRIVLESAAPHALAALANAGYGVAIVPSNLRMAGARMHVAALLHGGRPLGGWVAVSWDPRRFLPAYGEAFARELELFTRRTYPGRDFVRRAPPLVRPRTLHPGGDDVRSSR